VFKTHVLGRVTVLREAAKILLSGKDGVVSLNLFYTGKQVLGPTSLLTTHGEEHRKLRRLVGEPRAVRRRAHEAPRLHQRARRADAGRVARQGKSARARGGLLCN
jgi:cytochrome P450